MRKQIKDMRNYEQRIKKVVDEIEDIYENAPQDLIDKHKYLFASVQSNDPVLHDCFVYYPDTRIIRTPQDVAFLTRIEGRIFNLIAKNLKIMKYIPKDYIYTKIYNGRKSNMPTACINIHVLNINRKINDLNLNISNMYKRGLFLEHIDKDGNEISLHDDPFNVYPW